MSKDLQRSPLERRKLLKLDFIYEKIQVEHAGIL